MLYVVTHFVGDHIGLREVTRRAEALLELAVKAQIDVHLLVDRTIKGPHLRCAGATARARSAVEEHQGGGPIALISCGKRGRPGLLYVVEHEADEVAAIAAVLGRARALATGRG